MQLFWNEMQSETDAKTSRYLNKRRENLKAERKYLLRNALSKRNKENADDKIAAMQTLLAEKLW